MLRNTPLLLILVFLFNPATLFAAEDTPAPLPELVLPMPEQTEHRTYLGLQHSESATFDITTIEADLLIIELFSMYCPYCQEAAETVNELHQLLEERSEEKPTIRMIGLGANNTAFEVDHFRKTFDVPFPLFADEDMAMYNRLAGAGTPGFIACQRTSAGGFEIIHRRSGGFNDARAYLNELLEMYSR